MVNLGHKDSRLLVHYNDILLGQEMRSLVHIGYGLIEIQPQLHAPMAFTGPGAKSENIVNQAANLWATSFLQSHEVELKLCHLYSEELDLARIAMFTSIKRSHIARAETQLEVDILVILDTWRRFWQLSRRQSRWAHIKEAIMKERKTSILCQNPPEERQ